MRSIYRKGRRPPSPTAWSANQDFNLRIITTPKTDKNAATDSVYYIQCEGFVKIGYTTGEIKWRMESLRLGNPFPLTLLWAEPGGIDIEKEAHSRWAKFKHRGEWYRLEGALADFLNSKKEKGE